MKKLELTIEQVLKNNKGSLDLSELVLQVEKRLNIYGLGIVVHEVLTKGDFSNKVASDEKHRWTLTSSEKGH